MIKSKHAILAYTAGIIDGEGCIRINKRHSNRCRVGFELQLNVRVRNTNEWLIRWLQFQFGGSIRSDKQKGNRKDAWEWCLGTRQALEFLKQILPYLQIKRPQAELAVEFQRNKHFGRNRPLEQLAVEEAQQLLMSNYNRRGKLKANSIVI